MLAFLLVVSLAACGTEASRDATWANPPTTGLFGQTTATAPSTTLDQTTTTIPVTTSTLAQEPTFLALEAPIDGQFVVSSTLAVRGVATPDAVVRVGGAETRTSDDPGQVYEIDGEKVSSFELPIVLADGENVIEVKADGEETSQATVVVTVTYLPDAAEEFAYFKQVSATEVVADYAQFLTGEEADEAAVEAGVIEAGDHVPNDYFIVNENPRLRTWPVAEEAFVILPTFETGPVTDVPVPMDEWLAMFDEGEPWPEKKVPADDRFFGPGAPWASYWLTVSDGVVVQIRQQFLP